MWWASYGIVVLVIGFAVLWFARLVPHDEQLRAIIGWGAFVNALCLMVLSVVAAAMLGEASRAPATDTDGTEAGASRWRRTAAVRCWWASLAITLLGVASLLFWDEPGRPYDDSFGEAFWYLGVVGGGACCCSAAPPRA